MLASRAKEEAFNLAGFEHENGFERNQADLRLADSTAAAAADAEREERTAANELSAAERARMRTKAALEKASMVLASKTKAARAAKVQNDNAVAELRQLSDAEATRKMQTHRASMAARRAQTSAELAASHPAIRKQSRAWDPVRGASGR